MTTNPNLKQKVGCWLHERLRTEAVLLRLLTRIAGVRWQTLCNRNERLIPGSDETSWACDWEDSSWLTVARVFPRVGARLLRHCLAEWPVALSNTAFKDASSPAKVSVILPVMGADRIPLFRGTLASLLGQDCSGVEIIVAEQGEQAHYRHHLPCGVRHLLIGRVNGEEDFSRSRAFNVGVLASAAPVVLLHDADTIVPRSYVRSILDRLQAGWDAVRPLRFLFCFDQKESEQFLASGGAAMPAQVSSVMQNFSGCSVAVRREVYWQIGGHDERFVGWGGEDLEFLDRLRTTRLFGGGYAPAIHLWHPPAVKKAIGDRNNDLMERLRGQPPGERIERLRGMLRDVEADE